MKHDVKQTKEPMQDRTLDMRRPGIVKGGIVPVSRSAFNNMIVAPTSS